MAKKRSWKAAHMLSMRQQAARVAARQAAKKPIPKVPSNPREERLRIEKLANARVLRLAKDVTRQAKAIERAYERAEHALANLGMYIMARHGSKQQTDRAALTANTTATSVTRSHEAATVGHLVTS